MCIVSYYFVYFVVIQVLVVASYQVPMLGRATLETLAVLQFSLHSCPWIYTTTLNFNI